MMVIGGLERGTLDFYCECGRNLGKAIPDNNLHVIKCECGISNMIGEIQLKMNPRQSFVMTQENKHET